MRIYLVSLGAGILVGLIYSLLGVRSPAPPLVALIGLLGMLVGEQVIPVGRQMLAGTSLAAAWKQANCTGHIFGLLPGHHSVEPEAASAEPVEERS
jgi:XapX domain-containing protein